MAKICLGSKLKQLGCLKLTKANKNVQFCTDLFSSIPSLIDDYSSSIGYVSVSLQLFDLSKESKVFDGDIASSTPQMLKRVPNKPVLEGQAMGFLDDGSPFESWESCRGVSYETDIEFFHVETREY